MRGPLSEDRGDPWCELKVGDLLSALAFGASFEEIANFLVDNVAEREIAFFRARAESPPVFTARGADAIGLARPSQSGLWLSVGSRLIGAVSPIRGHCTWR
jgi:hypothetical protein